MAEKEGALSEYSSLYTESKDPTISTVDDEYNDVLIFYHDPSNLRNHVQDAKKLLSDENLSVKDSKDIALDAGRSKVELYISRSKRSKYRVFIINKAFITHDLQHYLCILDNAKISTPQNTLILARPVHRKKVPESLGRFIIKSLSNRMNGEEIANQIKLFMKENTPEAQSLVLPGRDPWVDDKQKNLELESRKSQFFDMVDHFDRRRIFILCACVKPIQPDCDCSELSYITWLKVFDFDSDSPTDGLLSVVKDRLQKGRFAVTSTQENPQNLNGKITDWTVVKTETDDSTVDFLHEHISSASGFCAGHKPATMLILWYHDPSDSDLEEELREFLSAINHDFNRRSIKIVLCLPKVPEDRTDLAKISSRHVQDRRVIAPLKKICEWMSHLAEAHSRVDREQRLLLPKLKEEDDDEETFQVDGGDVNWLQIDMQVLALKRLSEHAEPGANVIEQKGVDYLKGGDLTWEVVEDGSYDVTRDITQGIIEHVYTQHIKKGSCGVVTLFHSPGSGGTTVGRRVAWELRTKSPCLALDHKAEIKEDFKEKIKFIRDKSNSPVLLLVDGRSSQEVRNILDMCRYERIVILHVIRHYSPKQEPKSAKGVFFLLDSLSSDEASRFKTKLLKYGNAGIRKRMEELVREVGEGKSHSVFEFGLTAFHSEFRGVGKYVESHLLLKDKKENWHKVAALLSLVNYYGNRGLPAEFFSGTLGKAKYVVVDLESDIPELGQQLIRESMEDYDWKISHYIVAKEILEQYLSGNTSVKHDDDLSFAACRKLHSLAIDFLDCLKGHMGTKHSVRDDMLAIVKGIFIFRHDKETHGGDDYKKKSSLSRLITHINDEQNQTKIFEKLVEYFPNNAEFFAHFGRYLGKINQHENAVNALQTAVKIRTTYLKDADIDPATKGDEVLHRIHSMFGFAYNAHVRHMFGNHGLGYMTKNIYSAIPEEILRTIHDNVMRAVEEFKNCRKYSCPSVSPSYGYIGEIQARLHLTEFCKKFSNHNLSSLAQSKFLWDFIQDSFVECDFLLDQCMAFAGESQLVYREIQRFLNLYHNYFGSAVSEFQKWSGDGRTILSKRSRITLLKLRLKPQKREFRVFEDLTHPADSQEFVDLLEEVLDDRHILDIRISPYMEDWMKAIRISEVGQRYNLKHVRERVSNWNERKENGSLSPFYNYTLQFLLTIFDQTPDNLRILDELRKHLDVAQKSLRQNILETPREWIRCIGVNRNTIAMLMHCQELEVNRAGAKQNFRGCIAEAKTWFGKIDIDGTRLQVYFVPHKFNIRYFHARERRRVQFVIGFNPKRGAQAYDVSLLFETKCLRCKQPFEVPIKSRIICPACHFEHNGL